VKDSITLDDNDLTQYVFLDTLQDNTKAKLLFGLQNAIVAFNNQPGILK
jgi:hypothetical protein